MGKPMTKYMANLRKLKEKGTITVIFPTERFEKWLADNAYAYELTKSCAKSITIHDCSLFEIRKFKLDYVGMAVYFNDEMTP